MEAIWPSFFYFQFPSLFPESETPIGLYGGSCHCPVVFPSSAAFLAFITPEMVCPCLTKSPGRRDPHFRADAWPLGWWWVQQWCGTGHEGQWSKGTVPKAASSKGREESAILGKRENSKGVGKDRKAQENREGLVWLHAPSLPRETVSHQQQVMPSAAVSGLQACGPVPPMAEFLLPLHPLMATHCDQICSDFFLDHCLEALYT